MSATVSLDDLSSLFKTTVAAWVDDYAPSMGAALAYYTMFSIAPLLLIVISLAGFVFGQEAAEGEIFRQLRDLMGDPGAQAVQAMVASVGERPAESSIGALVGVVLLMIGATSVFGELQDALDRIWRAPTREDGSGWWGLIRSRLLSFGMILGIGFLLMVSLIASAGLSALGLWWAPWFGGFEVLLQAVNLGVGFAITTLLFAMIYKILPRVQIRWRDVWIGAAATALLFTFGKYLIGLYIGRSSVTSAFGAAGSLAVVLLWVYYSAQVFLLGAEFTWVYAHRFGSRRGQAPGEPGLPQDRRPGASDRAGNGASASTRSCVAILASLAVLSGEGCASVDRRPLPTVPKVDLARFAGDWYVIGVIPTYFEKHAHNAVESYSIHPDGTIATTFTFRKGSFDGPMKQFHPTGFVGADPSNALRSAPVGRRTLHPRRRANPSDSGV